MFHILSSWFPKYKNLGSTLEVKVLINTPLWLGGVLIWSKDDPPSLPHQVRTEARTRRYPQPDLPWSALKCHFSELELRNSENRHSYKSLLGDTFSICFPKETTHLALRWFCIINTSMKLNSLDIKLYYLYFIKLYYIARTSISISSACWCLLVDG